MKAFLGVVFTLATIAVLGYPVPALADNSFQCETGQDAAIVNACGARWEAANIRVHIAANDNGGESAACLTATAALLEDLAAKWLAADKYTEFTGTWPCGELPDVASATDDNLLAQACPNGVWSYENKGVSNCNGTAAAAPAAARHLAPVAQAWVAAGLSQQQADELTASYAYLVQDFCQKVEPQDVLSGAHASIIAYLKTQGIEEPRLSSPHPTGDEVSNVHELQREVGEAGVVYGSKVSATKIAYAAIRGLLGSVKDRYTVFLDPKSFAELTQGLNGTADGGVSLTYSIDDATKNLRIENVVTDGPADKAGVRDDDEISAINNRLVKDIIAGAPLDVQQARIQTLLRGDPGTKVKFAIVRAGIVIDPITITRETLNSATVFAKLLPDGIGYAQLSVFGQNTGSELTAALNRLQDEGAKTHILDLRFNGGGYLNAAIDVNSKFIPSGPIVTVRSRAGQNTEYDAEDTAITPCPLVVLVNAYTASAAELTAGAIEDRGVGTVIGTKTSGKGIVQTIFPLRDGSAVKVTTARYFTPSGRDIEAGGIIPQIESDVLEGTQLRPGDPGQDPQLDRAITFLRTQSP